MELNPWMLTLLGVGAGVLFVIILVALAIRVHAARGRTGGRRCTESATNKVVVTTIEEMDLAGQAGMLLLDPHGSGPAGGSLGISPSMESNASDGKDKKLKSGFDDGKHKWQSNFISLRFWVCVCEMANSIWNSLISTPKQVLSLLS